MMPIRLDYGKSRKGREKSLLALALLFLGMPANAATYYLRPEGNDRNSGLSPQTAWKTLARVQAQVFRPGDRILLQGGQTFTGSLLLPQRLSGSPEAPITVGSFGEGRATIRAGNGTAIRLENPEHVVVQNLVLAGDWNARLQQGNAGHGVECLNTLPGGVQKAGIRLEGLTISGFKHAGITLGSAPPDRSKSGFRDVQITRCITHDNGHAGITVWGAFDSEATGYAHANLVIRHCRAYNNRGVRKHVNHSGNGIVIGDVNGAVIERCVAHNNGEYNDYAGGGPVGIWAWDSNNVTIQYNESYANKTQTIDGGGFDFDGGVTNSVMQYNYSHDNQGAGYLICQFTGARPFHSNTVRYNISQNDGRKNGYGGIHFYNGGSGARDCDLYHNTIFVSPIEGKRPPAPVRFDSPTVGIRLWNNLFLTTGGVPLVAVVDGQKDLRFENNAYWSNGAAFAVEWSGQTFSSLEAWRKATGQEQRDNQPLGLFADPLLEAPGTGGTLCDADQLHALTAYRPRPGSPLIRAGLPFTPPLSRANTGVTDFSGAPLPQNAPPTIGALEPRG